MVLPNTESKTGYKTDIMNVFWPHLRCW